MLELRNTIFFCLMMVAVSVGAQQIVSDDSRAEDAFRLAMWTVDHNTSGQLLKAGGDYGGEWTRDISMNSWNAVSQLRPDVAEYSLWSVTNNKKTIGHQYWDKIVWTIAAWNHYLVTGREQFLADAYECCKASMKELEDSAMDKDYGLFMGPAVYQDGIAAYEEPIYDPQLDDKSYVLDHPNSHAIKCLSTNAVYYEAYRVLAKMAGLREPGAVKGYEKKAAELKKNFRKYFYDKKAGKLCYLIDHTGRKHEFQEGLGVAYAIMFDLVTRAEAQRIIANVYETPSGIPAVWPCFKRNSEEKPGRHNVMVWSHVNMYYASALSHTGEKELFYKEVNTIARLALEADPYDGSESKPNGNYHEIYTADGHPSGGWQCGVLWPPLNHQTWCATGMLRVYLYDIVGMRPAVDGLGFEPLGMANGEKLRLSDIPYRNATLDIEVKGTGRKVQFVVDGTPQKKHSIPTTIQGNHKIEILLH